ncbi:isomerase [Kitasatospora sp. NPDC002227]|uniref:5-carboxymethyl-2-hydroxymuconate Delta-isomerase n=1 Tax=Kitasatospora sp. NPDC002227 TaxID=3154773 RepID=UPI00332EABAB
MPQITVDRSWSVTLDRAAFAAELHPLVAGVIDGSVAECKTRFRRIEECFVGDGDASRAMVYLEIKIMAGRSAEVRTELTERVLELLQRQVGHAEGGELHLAVNVVELDGRFYRRAVA